MRLFTGEKKRHTLTMLGVAAMDEAAKKLIAKELRFRNGADEGWGAIGLINSYCYR
jgi:hypothetical protein